MEKQIAFVNTDTLDVLLWTPTIREFNSIYPFMKWGSLYPGDVLLLEGAVNRVMEIKEPQSSRFIHVLVSTESSYCRAVA